MLHTENSNSVSHAHEQVVVEEESYFDLLLREYNANKNNIKILTRLAEECYNLALYDDYIKYSLYCIEAIKTNTEDEFYMNYEYLLNCYFNCVNFYSMQNDYTLANWYLDYALKIVNDCNFPKFRKLFYIRAQVSNHLGKADEAIANYKQCLEINSPLNGWIDDYSYYDNAKIYSDISNVYFYSNKVKESLAYAELALAMHPSDELYVSNAARIRNKFIQQTESTYENKICVYAICKNEEKFVDRWLDSMQEADYIVVLDTGSTDGTFEKLKSDPRVYRVEQQVITPWRFDVARNESMKLIPDDANILFCTDLDEVLDAGWASIIKEKWISGHHVLGWYKYAWSHSDSGQPGRIFRYNKLHDKNWHWRAPVHEYINTNVYSSEYINSHTLDLFDSGMYLHHYPDTTKSRSSYLQLLELRVQEDPNDCWAKLYLAHEYRYSDCYDKSIELLNDILTNHKNEYTDLENASSYTFLGENYYCLNDLDKALYYYDKAISTDPTYRDPYLYAAEIHNEKNNFNIAVGYVNEALAKSYRHYSWLEKDYSWREQADAILAVSWFYLGDKDKSLQHIKNAAALNPSNEDVQSNLKIISENMQ